MLLVRRGCSELAPVGLLDEFLRAHLAAHRVVLALNIVRGLIDEYAGARPFQRFTFLGLLQALFLILNRVLTALGHVEEVFLLGGILNRRRLGLTRA